jgi:hypothetical protein
MSRSLGIVPRIDFSLKTSPGEGTVPGPENTSWHVSNSLCTTGCIIPVLLFLGRLRFFLLPDLSEEVNSTPTNINQDSKFSVQNRSQHLKLYKIFKNREYQACTSEYYLLGGGRGGLFLFLRWVCNWKSLVVSLYVKILSWGSLSKDESAFFFRISSYYEKKHGGFARRNGY